MDREVEAAEAYGRAAQLAEATGAGGEVWTLQLLRGGALERANRWAEAKQALQAALALAPEQPLVLNYLGYAKLERGEDLDGAEAMIAKAARSPPKTRRSPTASAGRSISAGGCRKRSPRCREPRRSIPPRSRSTSISATRSTPPGGGSRRASPGGGNDRRRGRGHQAAQGQARSRPDPGHRRALSGITERAYAKLNLALHVRGKMPDGRHAIETIFAFCEDGDELTAEPAEDLSLTISGPFADALHGNDNLILQAARTLRDAADVEAGAALTLDKRLPVASGIGGGSADAGGRSAPADADVGDQSGPRGAMAPSLGADVPACLLAQSCRGEGAGDQLQSIDLGLTGTPVCSSIRASRFRPARCSRPGTGSIAARSATGAKGAMT